MYDTEKRVELVKKRVLERYRRKERRGICRLSALCMALFAFLVGTVHTAAGQTQITARGMYGSILLHEDAGGYVLVGVISFATAVVITVLCIRLREREHRGQGTGKETPCPDLSRPPTESTTELRNNLRKDCVGQDILYNTGSNSLSKGKCTKKDGHRPMI